MQVYPVLTPGNRTKYVAEVFDKKFPLLRPVYIRTCAHFEHSPLNRDNFIQAISNWHVSAISGCQKELHELNINGNEITVRVDVPLNSSEAWYEVFAQLHSNSCMYTG